MATSLLHTNLCCLSFHFCLPFSFEASKLLQYLHSIQPVSRITHPHLFARILHLCVCGSGQNSIVGLLSSQLHSTAHAESSPIRSLHGHRGTMGAIVLSVHTHIHIPLDPPLWHLLLASRFRPFSSHCMSKHIYSQQLVTVNGRRELQQTPLNLVCNFSSTNIFLNFSVVINHVPVNIIL